MGRIYTASFEDVAVTAGQDLFEVNVPSTMAMILHEVRITQSSDAGDAESEQIRARLIRHVGGTSGSGGTSVTPSKQATGDPAATVTVEANNTTQRSGGTETKLRAESDNIHNGYLHAPAPGKRYEFAPSERLIIELEGAPADSLTMDGYIEFEEIG
jgi:hypothetical protein